MPILKDEYLANAYIRRRQQDRDTAIQFARAILDLPQFFILDLETTGLEDDDEAVSVGLIDHEGQILIDTLLRHQKRSHPEALALHGHSWAETRSAPPFAEIHPELTNILTGQTVVTYSTNDFDRRILRQTCRRYKLPEIEFTALELLEPFAAFYGQWNDYYGNYKWQKLVVAARVFGLSTDGAHGAAADCLMTLGVIRGMAGGADLRGGRNPPNPTKTKPAPPGHSLAGHEPEGANHHRVAAACGSPASSFFIIAQFGRL